MNNQDYLIHYGVLGMRWGHRKQRVRSLRSGRNFRVSKKRTNRLKSSKVSKNRSVRKSLRTKISNIDKEKVKSTAIKVGKIAAITALSSISGATIGAVAYNAALAEGVILKNEPGYFTAPFTISRTNSKLLKGN